MSEKKAIPSSQATHLRPAEGVRTQSHLKEANEQLILATLEAQIQAEAAERAKEELAQAAKAEAHLQELQRLETLGTRAGGVAHDFNNLLTAIVGNADLGILAVKGDRTPEPFFEAIEKAAMKAAELTRQLLAFTGKERTVLTDVDLRTVVTEIILLIQASLPAQLTIHRERAEHLPLVRADATQIFKVLLTLTQNAGEAFKPDEAGQITIRTHAETLDAADIETTAWALPIPPGLYATLEVADTGAGMTPEIQARIFEPFFSTKFAGRGLGLAAAMGVLRTHKGGLRVLSAPGQGSSFKIFLPALGQAPPTPIDPGSVPALS